MTLRPVVISIRLDDEAQKALGDAIIATGQGGRPSYAEIAEFAAEAFEERYKDEVGDLGVVEVSYRKNS